MSRGVGSNPCDECRRTFSGQYVFGAHRLQGRCMTASELRRRGFVRRDDGTWSRPSREAKARRGWQGRLWHQGRPPRPRELAPGIYRHVRPQREHTANRANFLGQLTLFLLASVAGRAA